MCVLVYGLSRTLRLERHQDPRPHRAQMVRTDCVPDAAWCLSPLLKAPEYVYARCCAFIPLLGGRRGLG